MNENLKWCIDYLKNINGIDYEINLPSEDCLRALMNITLSENLSTEFFLKQDQVLKEINLKRKLIDVYSLNEIVPKISLIKADIVTLKCDAIVNACNEKLLGCFVPLHNCIDNAIHSFAGLEVRRDLLLVMKKQNHDEKNGQVKVTKGYNLPSRYIFHTVGPRVNKIVTIQDEIDLKNCYFSCLKMADKMGLKTIAFPSISTGIYSYPIQKACKIAIKTVKDYLKSSKIERVIFDVFKDEDYELYFNEIKNAN